MRQLIIDVETTGLSPKTDRIVEFAAIEMIDNKLTVDYLHLYFNPECEIPERVSAIHGLTFAELQDKPKFGECWFTVANYMIYETLTRREPTQLIMYNANFDYNFIFEEFVRCKICWTESKADIIDTLQLAKTRFSGERNSLDALCDRFGIDRSHRTKHSALVDCHLLHEVYQRLI